MKVVLNNLTKIMDLAHGVKVQGTAALDMCAVGVGYCDAYYQMGLHCWDMAAGCVIVREAGGVVVDINRSMGSAALNMCLVALGGADAYYEMGIHAWDMAAGVLIATEAGGYICDLNGEPFDVLSRRVICASSKEVADQLVSILEIFEEERD
ncbi:Inositol monophosphatase 1 [Armadillidium vulgare]|nr:Inositol monophosphatase 1 [Armadillidium vulgare]